MLKFFNELFSKCTPTSTKVTFVIAVVGFLISVASGILNLLRQRKNFDIIIHSVKAYDTVIFLSAAFVNKSRLPILITRIALQQRDTSLECTAVPVKVASFTDSRNGQVLSHREIFSKQLPIALSSLGGDSGVILFENVRAQLEDSATHATFLVGTNRGKTVKKILALPPEWHLTRTTAQ